VYNLSGTLDAAFSRMDWAPSQADVAKRRGKEFVSNAVLQLALEAPSLFDEDEVRIAVEEDGIPTLDSDTLEVSGGDAWVLQTALAIGTTDALVWNTDGEWDARGLLIKVPDSDPAEWHLFRIREVWSASTSGTGGTVVRYLVSLDRPLPLTASTTDIEYKVVRNEFVLPDDVIEVRSMALLESSTSYPYPLEVLGQEAAEYATFPNNSDSRSEGTPRAVYRRQRQALAGPSLVPGVETVDINWLGPEPVGTFEYAFTYRWGRQEEWTHSPGPVTMDATAANLNRQEPYWESPPSPVSAQTSPTTSNNVMVYLPNVDHMLGFDEALTRRYRRAGIKKRIYRRRVSAANVAATLPGTLAYPQVESPDRFYLLTEVDGHVTQYQDNGSDLPDIRRPLRTVHSYQTFRLYPSPEQRYELIIRCVKRPEPLVADTDAPKVTPDAVEAIILRTMAYLYEMQGNAAMSARKLQEYERSVSYLLKRYGDLRPAGRPRRRAVARPGRRTLGYRRDLSGVVRNA
jgi:hypothetical protein